MSGNAMPSVLHLMQTTTFPCMASPFSPRGIWQVISRHRVLSVVFLVLFIVLVAFSAYIGFVPMAALALPVAVIAWVMFVMVGKSRQSGRREATTLVTSFAASTVLVFGLIQLVPYGRDHTNPPVTGEPAWATPRTRELMVRACYGCHSNEVEYPSYASVAPISWMVQSHIDEGRDEVNYSEWDQSTRGGDDTIEVILDGSMPPSYYTRFGLHPEAKLTDAEIQELVAGLRATPGLNKGEEGGGYGEDAD